MKIQFFISSENIIAGQKLSPTCCPAALAINQRLNCTGTTTRIYGSWVVDGVYAGKYGQHPQRLVDWIMAYDRGDVMNPIIFELDMIEAES